MSQQVSPAVVVIVLILLIAVMVALYFLVITAKQAPAEDTAGVGAPVSGGTGEAATEEGETEATAGEAEAEGAGLEAEESQEATSGSDQPAAQPHEGPGLEPESPPHE